MKQKSFGWAAATIGVLVAMSAPARAQGSLPTEPILRIETGMHGGQLRRIDVNADCSLMVTGSYDKTARLWALPKGGVGQATPLRALRVPIGPDEEDGKVYAVALSPNGRFVAAGGRDVFADRTHDFGVYIFEAETGRVVRRLGQSHNTIAHLTFSRDGKRLAATLGDGGGLRIWETTGWTLIGQDEDYGGLDAFGAAFDAKGQLYTVANDGFLRRYGEAFKVEVKTKTVGGTTPYSIAVHPRGDRLAVGFTDSSAVEVYDTSNLTRLFATDTAGTGRGAGHGSFYGVAWSANGASLYAGGTYSDAQDKRVVRIWNREGRGSGRNVVVPQITVLQLLSCGGGIALGAANPAFGLMSASGERRVWEEGVIADMRNKLGENFTVSDDASKVRFGLGVGGERPVLFDLISLRLTDQPQSVAGLAPPDTESLKITDWANLHTPKLDDVTLRPELLPGGMTRSVAIAPGGDSFVLGGRFLRKYRKDGQLLREIQVPGTAWGVNVPRGGKFVVVAYDDGTIRWHRLSDLQEVIAFFVNTKTREWVLWTPQGYYASSVFGDRNIGWHVNRDWENAADFVTAARLKKHLYRPDIVKRAFEMLDAEGAVQEVGLSGFKLADLASRTPPAFSIVDPSDKTHAERSPLAVKLALAETDDPVTGFDVNVNGRQVTTPDARNIDQPSKDAETRALSVPLEKGENHILIAAHNGVGETVQNLLVYLDREGALDQKGRLFILAIGIDTYPKLGPTWTLKYAAADATLILDTLTKKAGPLHTGVVAKLLVSNGDTPPTKANIENAIHMFGNARPEDTVILFVASHGVNVGADYMMIPEDSERSEGDHWRPSSVVKWSVLQEALQAAPGNRIMFVDTCHSGGAYSPRLVKDAVDANIVVISATDGHTDAQERDELGHGAFTYALNEGLTGAADFQKNGEIGILELSAYVAGEVKHITHDAQEPVTNLAGVKDFVLALKGTR
jgi:hypothetical protein